MILKQFKNFIISICSIFLLGGCFPSSTLELFLQDDVKIVNDFINSKCIDATMSIYLGSSHDSDVELYADDEVISIRYKEIRSDKNRIVNKAYTPTKSYLEGDGYKVVTNVDNSDYFTNSNYYNLKEHYRNLSLDVKTKELKFDIDLVTMSNTVIGGFAFEGINYLKLYYSLGYDNLHCQVYFNESRVRNISFIYRDIDKETSKLKAEYIVSILVENYGKDMPKKNFDSTGYLEVDGDTYYLVSEDVASYMKGQETFYLEPTKSDSVYMHYVPEGEIIAKFILKNKVTIDIKFDDLVYDTVTGKYYYPFAGKRFNIAFNILTEPLIEKVGTKNFELYLKDDFLYLSDYEDDRYLIETRRGVQIIDINTLNIVKTISVTGTLTNILRHDNVYHILSIVEEIKPDYGYPSYKGKIYVVDATSLELTSEIDVDACPYYSVVDNRGDIIFTSRYRSQDDYWVIYHYHMSTGEVTHIISRYIEVASYLDYKKDQDLLISNNTEAVGGVLPTLFEYVDGEFIEKKDYPKTQYPITPYGKIYAKYYNYILGLNSNNQYLLVDIKNWLDPIAYQFLYASKANDVLFFFMEKEAISSVNSPLHKGETYFTLTRDTPTEKTVNREVIYFKGDVRNYSFGFMKEGSLYLYQKATQMFDIYPLN